MSLDCKAFVTGLTRLKEVLDQALTICDYADGSEIEPTDGSIAETTTGAAGGMGVGGGGVIINVIKDFERTADRAQDLIFGEYNRKVSK